MKKLISAATDMHFDIIIREEKFDRAVCLFIPYGPADQRKRKLHGLRVDSIDQLIGAFDVTECDYLTGKGGSL